MHMQAWKRDERDTKGYSKACFLYILCRKRKNRAFQWEEMLWSTNPGSY
jgi:hypothetical protein